MTLGQFFFLLVAAYIALFIASAAMYLVAENEPYKTIGSRAFTITALAGFAVLAIFALDSLIRGIAWIWNTLGEFP